MSYSRTYQETVSGSTTVSYPASQNGGTTTATVTIPVTINIHVDTDPFDNSVNSCNNHINVLTGSVVATEAAEILAINENSQKVAETVVDGFFKYIRFDISQQISEIKPKVDVMFLQLVKQQESCIAKKNQMSGDFARISERYTKIFNDLDKETSNRVKALNQSAFNSNSQINLEVSRSFDTSLFNTSTIFNSEGSSAHSALFSSGLKRRTLSLINNAKKFLISDKVLGKKVKSILLDNSEGQSATYYLPVVFYEFNSNNEVNSEIKCDNKFNPFQSTELKAKTTEFFNSSKLKWKKIEENSKQQIGANLQLKIDDFNSDSDAHKKRVSELIWQLWNNCETNVISN
jgi:hypothetical protein